MNDDNSKQWSGALLAMFAIACITLVGVLRHDVPALAILPAITGLGTRAAGLVVHALKGSDEKKDGA